MADSVARFAVTVVAMAATTLIGLSIKSPQTPKHNIFIKQGNFVGLGNAAVRGTPNTTHTIMQVTNTTQAVTHTVTQKIIQTVESDARKVARELIHKVKTQVQSSASLFWQEHWATIIVVAATLIGFAVALSYVVTSRFFAKLLTHTLKTHILPVFEKFAATLENQTLRMEALEKNAATLENQTIRMEALEKNAATLENQTIRMEALEKYAATLENQTIRMEALEKHVATLENQTLRIEAVETKRLMVDAATMTIDPGTSTDKIPLRHDGHLVVADDSANKSPASDLSTTVSASEAVVVAEPENVDIQADSPVSSIKETKHTDSENDEESEDWETDIDEQDAPEEDIRGPAGTQSSHVKGFIGHYAVEEPAGEEDSVQEDSAEEAAGEEDSVHEHSTEEAPVEEAPVEEAAIEEDFVQQDLIPQDFVRQDPIPPDFTHEDFNLGDFVHEDSAEEAPIQEDSAEEAPVEEAPVEEAPVEEAPVEEAPVEEAPVEEAPVEEAPVEEAPVHVEEDFVQQDSMFTMSSKHGSRRILPPVSRKRRSHLRRPDQVAQKDPGDDTDSWNKTNAFGNFGAVPLQFLGGQIRDNESIFEDVEETPQDEEVIFGVGKTISQFSSSLIRDHLRATEQDKPPSQQIAKSGPASVLVQNEPIQESSTTPTGDQQLSIITQTPDADTAVLLQEDIHHKPTAEIEEAPATSATQTIPQLATQPTPAPLIEPVLPQLEIQDVGEADDVAGAQELSQEFSFGAEEEMPSHEGTQPDPTETDDQLNVTPPILAGTAATEKDFLKVVLDVEPPKPNVFLDNARWCLDVCEKYRELYLEPRAANLEDDVPGAAFDIQLDAGGLTKFSDIEFWEERKDKKTPIALRRVYENQLKALYHKWHTQTQVRGNLYEAEDFNIGNPFGLADTDRSPAAPRTPVTSQMSSVIPLKLAKGHRSVEEILADAKANGFVERKTRSSPRKVAFLMKNTPPRKMTESVEVKTRREAREALLAKEKQRADKEREENAQGKYGSEVRSWLPLLTYMTSSQSPKGEEPEQSTEVEAATQSEQGGQVDRLDDAELDEELFGDSDEGEME